MSNVHIATAANEVAGALPSTATVTVSKHGISAIETLNLEARTASQSHLMWSRTFSGMEIVTNPTLHYMVSLELTGANLVLSAVEATAAKQISALQQVARLTSDPISTASSNISVTVNNAEMTVTPDKESRIITTTYPDERSPAHQRCHYGLNQLDQFADARFREFSNAPLDDVEKQHNANTLRENYPKRIYYNAGSGYTLLAPGTNDETITGIKFVWDVYQPLAHPYFRDNKMRDNTLVNLRYFDCQIYIDSTDKLIELAPSTVTSGDTTVDTFVQATTSSTKLLLKDDTIGTTNGIDPTLIFDLITPSVPLPTISDKPLKVLHTMTSTAVSTSLNMDQVRSGNIQLSQVPDMIYVFLRSNKMDSYAAGTAGALTEVTPTRLGVCTNLRVRTPQNAAFLLNMDQESLYQMSVRNGSKQSRSAFMCTLGSVICIDPEKDLGGYTNGVLAPFTFEVVGDFSQPCVSDSKSRLWISDIVRNQTNALRTITAPSTGEYFTLYVVCELHGHLYLMSDGTGKQTKSNLTVSEVAEAVGEGVHHPSTFPMGRVSKMDSGVLSEVANSSGDVGDDVRAALRD